MKLFDTYSERLIPKKSLEIPTTPFNANNYCNRERNSGLHCQSGLTQKGWVGKQNFLSGPKFPAIQHTPCCEIFFPLKLQLKVER
jgi:hypothetical protein